MGACLSGKEKIHPHTKYDTPVVPTCMACIYDTEAAPFFDKNLCLTTERAARTISRAHSRMRIRGTVAMQVQGVAFRSESDRPTRVPLLCKNLDVLAAFCKGVMHELQRKFPVKEGKWTRVCAFQTNGSIGDIKKQTFRIPTRELVCSIKGDADDTFVRLLCLDAELQFKISASKRDSIRIADAASF